MSFSNGMSLPHINRGHSDGGVGHASSSYPIEMIEEENGVKKFDMKVKELAEFSFPTVDPEASVKARIQTLENSSIAQGNYNSLSLNAINNLSQNVMDVDGNIKSLMLSMQNDFDQKLLSMKKEYDHRFVAGFTMKVRFLRQLTLYFWSLYIDLSCKIAKTKGYKLM
jgi:hypothetical protein